MNSRGLSLVLVGLLALLGCSSGEGEADLPLIVTTTSIVGDLVTGVVGHEAKVEIIMPVGVDPHDYQPSARQAASLREADLIVTSGLGLEAGLVDALAAAAADGVPTLALGERLGPRPLNGADGTSPDPCWWLDPNRAAGAVQLIAEAMSSQTYGNWHSRATAIETNLWFLADEIALMLCRIPPEHRDLITTHDTFGYFAERYDLDVVGVLLEDGATQPQLELCRLAELADTMRADDIHAVFAETTAPTEVAETLAESVGEDVDVVPLYVDSLGGPGSGAETYFGMMRTNAERIADALG
jgi:zinc/manganese transport system substrate-binding protein